ncbi:Carbamoyl-phosphate synthase [Arthromyces matolae]|nr:Carbamoyl-phosphate synthase [Arthromyces matolae]
MRTPSALSKLMPGLPSYIIPPKKDIFFLIGSYRKKTELLLSIQKLSIAGYNLFATSGTADFLTKHNVPRKYLEMLIEDSQ